MTGITRTINANNPDIKVLEEAASLILKGELLVCPTDTGYAFAANALDTIAIGKIFTLKKRSSDNPIHVAVSSMVEAEKYAYVNETARILAREFLPGALTLILPRREIVPPLLTGNRDTIGIRVPDNQAILTIAHIADCPLTATSANISGKGTPYAAEEVVEQLGDSIHGVALILDQGELTSREVSTIVDLSTTPPRILRQGRIGKQDILRVLYSRAS